METLNIILNRLNRNYFTYKMRTTNSISLFFHAPTSYMIWVSLFYLMGIKSKNKYIYIRSIRTRTNNRFKRIASHIVSQIVFSKIVIPFRVGD